MTRNKDEYRNLTIEEIVALDDELRRDYLETLIREHTESMNIVDVLAGLARQLEESDRNDAIETASDEDEYLTELLDKSTDDGLVDVLSNLIGTGTSLHPKVQRQADQ
jgi:hypothetical protein